MTYFALGGFLVLAEMDREQRELDDEEGDDAEEVQVGGNEDEEESEEEEDDEDGQSSQKLTDNSFDANIVAQNTNA